MFRFFKIEDNLPINRQSTTAIVPGIVSVDSVNQAAMDLDKVFA